MKSKIICTAAAMLMLTSCSGLSELPFEQKMPDGTIELKESRKDDTESKAKPMPDYPFEPYGITMSADYFLQYFDEDVRAVYNELYNGMFCYTPEIDVTDGVVKEEDFPDMLTFVVSTGVFSDSIQNDYKIYLDDEGYVTKAEINYSLDRERGAEQYSQLMTKAKDIVSGITEDMSDYDKLIYLHDTLINCCTYDENGEFSHSAYGALCDGRAVCEGYTRAFALLCEQAGILTVPVSGNAQNESGVSSPHIWNKVFADDTWYNVDCTWDDPKTSDNSAELRYDYFLVGDADLVKSHTEEANVYMPAPVAWYRDGTYFDHEGLMIDGYTDVYDAFYEQVKKAFESTDSESIIRMRCTDSYTYENAKAVMFTAEDGQENQFVDVLREFMTEGTQMSYIYSGNDLMNVITVRLVK